MRITRALNLTVTLDRADGTQMHVHSVPIPRAVFERFWHPMARAFARIFNEGLGTTAGPRVALLMLREVCGGDALDRDGQPDHAARAEWVRVETGLIAEVERLTNVAVPLGWAPPTDELPDGGATGWELQPFATLVARGILDEEDRADILTELLFFTLVVRMSKPNNAQGVMALASALWGSRDTSLGPMEWMRSLPISTAAASSGGTDSTSSPTASTTPAPAAGSGSPTFSVTRPVSG